MDVDFEHVWFVGLVVGGVAAVVAFAAAKLSAGASARRRRLLFAVAAFCALGTAVVVGVTGLFFVLFSGYCEDAGYCEPDWWVWVGLGLLALAIVLGGLMGRAIQEYRRVP